MIKDCFVKNKQGETKMQMLDSKSSTRLQENQDSHQKAGSIVSSTIAMKGDQEIKESRLFISAMVKGVQCTLYCKTLVLALPFFPIDCMLN